MPETYLRQRMRRSGTRYLHHSRLNGNVSLTHVQGSPTAQGAMCCRSDRELDKAPGVS